MHTLLQGAVLAAAAVTVVCLARVIAAGRAMRTQKDPFNFETHYVRLWEFVFSIGLLALCVILLGQTEPTGRTEIPHLLIEIHLLFVTGVFTAGTLIAFRFSGARVPAVHRYWVYCGFMPFYIGMVVTGVWLTLAR